MGTIHTNYYKIENSLSAMFRKFGVPDSGKADNQAGEMVRAMCRIRYRWFNDGDKINLQYGRETCNAPARYLKIYGNAEMKKLVNHLFDSSYLLLDDEYQSTMEKLAEETISFIENHPELAKKETIDMWDLFDKYEDDERCDYDEEDEEEW